MWKRQTKDWEQRKVTELGEIYIGLVTTMTAHYTDKGALLIRNSDIRDGYFEFGDNPIYLDEEFVEQNSSRKHQVGDVITVHTGDIGTSAVITENEAGSIGFATIVTRPDTKKIIPKYLCAYLNTDTHKRFAMRISTGDGRNNYNLKDYYNCVVPFPNLEEQRKISDYIQSINHLITLHQRKPYNITDSSHFVWEQRKLGEMLISLQNNTFSRADLSNETGVAKNIHYGDVLIRFGEVLDVSKEHLPMITDEKVLTKYKLHSYKMEM